MFKLFKQLIFFSLVAVYIASSYTPITKRITTFRVSSSSIFSSDKYRYGDLYGMCFLPEYQIALRKESDVPLVTYGVTSQIHLYVIGDSYFRVPTLANSSYCGVDSIFFVRFGHEEKLNVKLDSQNTNILLLEISERSFRSYFYNASYVNELVKATDKGEEQKKHLSERSSFMPQLTDVLFNTSINTNLELNIWDFAIITPVKEFKANVNYKLFNVVDEYVTIAPDKKYLLYKPTTDTTASTSAFQHIPGAAIDSFVTNLNLIYKRSKKLGFKEVYLSIIPNPVSILYPNLHGMKYNLLIPRVQHSPDLLMPVIDIYSVFKNTSLQVYERSDTHWNMTGAVMWLNKLNSLLVKQSDSSLNDVFPYTGAIPGRK